MNKRQINYQYSKQCRQYKCVQLLYLMRMAGLMRGQGSVSSAKYLAIADSGSAAPDAALAPAPARVTVQINSTSQKHS